MIPAPFRYHRASSLYDASMALKTLGDGAKLIAGGQSLLPLMKLRLIKPTDLVDVSADSDAQRVMQEGRQIDIGALVTHAAMGRSELARRYPVLADCALGIADAQVRSMGTLGGSLAEADPSSCWPVLLLALDAQVQCVGLDGRRLLNLSALLENPYAPSLQPFELIEAVRVDSTALEGHGAFVAFKRSAPAYPTASCALQITFDGARCRSARLALGCVNLIPLRIPIDDLIQGRECSAEVIQAVAQRASLQCQPMRDNKGSIEYKRSLVAGLVRRAFAVIEARRLALPSPPTHTYYG